LFRGRVLWVTFWSLKHPCETSFPPPTTLTAVKRDCLQAWGIFFNPHSLSVMKGLMLCMLSQVSSLWRGQTHKRFAWQDTAVGYFSVKCCICCTFVMGDQPDETREFRKEDLNVIVKCWKIAKIIIWYW